MIEFPLYSNEINVNFQFNQKINSQTLEGSIKVADKAYSKLEINPDEKSFFIKLNQIKAGTKYPIILMKQNSYTDPKCQVHKVNPHPTVKIFCFQAGACNGSIDIVQAQ